MKWIEFVAVALRVGAAAAEAVREARRKGDTPPARNIWRELKSQRVADDAARERRAAIEAEARRHGASYGEDE